MFKKLFYRLILLTLVGMLVAPFILKRENGTTIMSMDEFLDFDFEIIKQRYELAISTVRGFLSEDMKVERLKEEPEDDKVTKLYKWQDENGEWHFSDVKSDKFPHEEVRILNDRNVLKFEDLQKKDGKNKEKSGETPRTTNDINNIDSQGKEESKGSVNKDGVIKGYLNNMTSTMKKAKNVQSQIDADYQRKSQVIDGSY